MEVNEDRELNEEMEIDEALPAFTATGESHRPEPSDLLTEYEFPLDFLRDEDEWDYNNCYFTMLYSEEGLKKLLEPYEGELSPSFYADSSITPALEHAPTASSSTNLNSMYPHKNPEHEYDPFGFEYSASSTVDPKALHTFSGLSDISSESTTASIDYSGWYKKLVSAKNMTAAIKLNRRAKRKEHVVIAAIMYQIHYAVNPDQKHAKKLLHLDAQGLNIYTALYGLFNHIAPFKPVDKFGRDRYENDGKNRYGRTERVAPDEEFDNCVENYFDLKKKRKPKERKKTHKLINRSYFDSLPKDFLLTMSDKAAPDVNPYNESRHYILSYYHAQSIKLPVLGIFANHVSIRRANLSLMMEDLKADKMEDIYHPAVKKVKSESPSLQYIDPGALFTRANQLCLTYPAACRENYIHELLLNIVPLSCEVAAFIRGRIGDMQDYNTPSLHPNIIYQVEKMKPKEAQFEIDKISNEFNMASEKTCGFQTRAHVRSSFGFLMPSFSHMPGKVRLWPGLIPVSVLQTIVSSKWGGAMALKERAAQLHHTALRVALRHCKIVLRDCDKVGDQCRDIFKWLLTRLNNNLSKAAYLCEIHPALNKNPKALDQDYVKTCLVIENLIEYSRALRAFSAHHKQLNIDFYPLYLENCLSAIYKTWIPVFNCGEVLAASNQYTSPELLDFPGPSELEETFGWEGEGEASDVLTYDVLSRETENTCQDVIKATIFYMDSGMQGLVSSVLAYTELYKEVLSGKPMPVCCIGTYFELLDALSSKALRSKLEYVEPSKSGAAHVVVSDLRPGFIEGDGIYDTNAWEKAYNSSMKLGLILDITNSGVYAALDEISKSDYLDFRHPLFLVESLTKHHHLGSDKYTMARVIVIGKTTQVDTIGKYLQPIADCAFDQLQYYYRRDMDEAMYAMNMENSPPFSVTTLATDPSIYDSFWSPKGKEREEKMDMWSTSNHSEFKLNVCDVCGALYGDEGHDCPL